MLLSTEQRIEAIDDSPINKVGSAISLAAAMDKSPSSGVNCFVVPVDERPEASKRVSGPALQKIMVTIGVVFAVRSLNDPTGEKGSARLEDARNAVRDALFGWQPESATGPYLLANSSLIRMDKNTLWWMDRYQTQIQRRAQQ
jgi:hypothetical protein